MMWIAMEGKRRPSILPKLVLEALEAHFGCRNDEDLSLKAKIMAISPPGRSRGCWKTCEEGWTPGNEAG